MNVCPASADIFYTLLRRDYNDLSYLILRYLNKRQTIVLLISMSEDYKDMVSKFIKEEIKVKKFAIGVGYHEVKKIIESLANIISIQDEERWYQLVGEYLKILLDIYKNTSWGNNYIGEIIMPNTPNFMPPVVYINSNEKITVEIERTGIYQENIKLISKKHPNLIEYR